MVSATQSRLMEGHLHDVEGPATLMLEAGRAAVQLVKQSLGKAHNLAARPFDYPDPGIPAEVMDKQPKGPAYFVGRAAAAGAGVLSQELAAGAKVVANELGRSLRGYDVLAAAAERRSAK